MNPVKRLALYFDLFSLIAQIPRIPPYLIAKEMNKTHKKRAAHTYTKHIQTMYEKGISFPPEITLKPYLGFENIACFCRKTDEKDLYDTFLKLHEDIRISYVLLLSGCDFFLTTREKKIEDDLNCYGLEIQKISNMYTPVYTIPKGWNLSMEKAFNNLTEFNFKKGLFERDVFRNLEWDELDWKIYRLMRPNIRQKWIRISQRTGVYLSTVKRHFIQKILPKCVTINYFFPKGFKNYLQIVLKIHSKYEKSLIKSFEMLPCTTIVFPLESELIIFLYHENVNCVLEAIQKIGEIGIIDTYHLFNPVMYGKPD